MAELYDFLYTDPERIASLLIQLSEDGAPKEASSTATRDRGKTKTGGIDAFGIKGELGSSGSSSYEVRQTYDPLWQNSQKLIQEVKAVEKGYSTNKTDIGQIRDFSGKLLAYDQSTIPALMQTPSIENFIAGGIKDSDGMEKRSKAVKDKIKKDEAAVIREYLKSLPLGVGFVLVTENEHFWFSVNKEYLYLYDLDIPLKFPTHVSGIWNVVGVVDAKPNDHVSGMQDVIDKKVDGLLPPMVLHTMQLTSTITGMFGRPIQAYGLSPLIIYRNIRGG